MLVELPVGRAKMVWEQFSHVTAVANKKYILLMLPVYEKLFLIIKRYFVCAANEIVVIIDKWPCCMLIKYENQQIKRTQSRLVDCTEI